MNSIFADANARLTAARREWGWFLALGLALIACGAVAILYQGASTIAATGAIGAILIFAGVFQLLLVFQARGAGHVILYLLMGVLDIVVGLAVIEHPGAGALLLTLVVAIYLVVGGIFRAIFALWMQFPQYGWAAFSGVLAAVLGVLLWVQWPTSATWFIGFAVGVNFIFMGVGYCAFALRLRNVLGVANQ